MRRLVMLLLVVSLAGCTLMTGPQKDWVLDKANRSEKFVGLMDSGQTTRVQEQEWVRSQDDSWREWARHVKNGIAAPSFLVRPGPGDNSTVSPPGTP